MRQMSIVLSFAFTAAAYLWSSQSLAADIVECRCKMELWSRNDWKRPGRVSTFVVTKDGAEILRKDMMSPVFTPNVPIKVDDGVTTSRYFLGACPSDAESPYAFIHAPVENWSYPEANVQVSILPHAKYSNGSIHFVWSQRVVDLPSYAEAHSDDHKAGYVQRMNAGEPLQNILLQELHELVSDMNQAIALMTERIHELPADIVTEDLKEKLVEAIRLVAAQDIESAKKKLAELDKRVTLLEGTDP